ncbi:MAG TPA: transporter associated domain-containing protein [Nitrospiraceae bacterium]|nr:transporter associated domain-containing protein [Nitrospiraceae bacterium]
MNLLENFRQSGDHYAFVVDEYGTVLELITLHDLLEAITGSIKAATTDDERAVRREDGSWLFDGQLSIHELSDYLGVHATLEDPDASYRTLSGLIIHERGHLPRLADRVNALAGYSKCRHGRTSRRSRARQKRAWALLG